MKTGTNLKPRRTFLLTGMLLLVVVTLSSVSVSSAAPSAPGFYRVRDSLSNMYVRSNAGGFVIGTVFGKDTPFIPGKTISDGFYLRDTGDGYWQWGYASGNAQLCGWIAGDYLNSTRLSTSTGPACPNPKYDGAAGLASRQHLLAHYAYQLNDCGASGDTCTGDNTTFTTVNPGTWSGYGNYGFFSDQQLHSRYETFTITSGTVVGWRYVTKDRRAVLIRDNTHDQWLFVPRAALPHCLKHSGGATVCG